MIVLMIYKGEQTSTVRKNSFNVSEKVSLKSFFLIDKRQATRESDKNNLNFTFLYI